MRFSHFATPLSLALLLSPGCSEENLARVTDSTDEPIMTCRLGNAECADSNGDSPHQPFQGFGTDNTVGPATGWGGWRYKPTGMYYNDQVRNWLLRGYYVDPSNHSHSLYDVRVAVRTSDNSLHGIDKVQAPPNVETMAISYCEDSTCSMTTTVEGDKLNDIALFFSLPPPLPYTGGPETPITLTFSGGWVPPAEPADRYGKDVVGIVVNWSTNGVPATALCKGAKGSTQLLVPQGGNLWNPTTFERLNPTTAAVSFACEKGAITYCRLWGYWEGYQFGLQNGQQANKSDIQQACINMKVANYCGTGPAQTKYGTEIFISDPISPTVHSAFGNTYEAIWGDKGAVCDNGIQNHRHPEIPNPAGCNIPTCTATQWISSSASNFISSLP